MTIFPLRAQYSLFNPYHSAKQTNLTGKEDQWRDLLLLKPCSHSTYLDNDYGQSLCMWQHDDPLWVRLTWSFILFAVPGVNLMSAVLLSHGVCRQPEAMSICAT